MKGGPTEFDKAMGAIIREIRVGEGITQQQLASKVGVTFQQIQKYESGVNRLCVERLVDISEAINTTPCSLIKLARAA